MTLTVVMVPQVYTYIQTKQIVFIEYVQFFVYQLYISKAIKIIIIIIRGTLYWERGCMQNLCSIHSIFKTVNLNCPKK